MALVYAGAPLVMEPKVDYIARKEEEKKNRPAGTPADAEEAGAAPTTKPAPTKPAAAKPAAAAAASKGKKRRAEGEPEEDEAEGGEGEAAEAAAAGEAAEEEVEVPEYQPGCVLAFDFGEDAEFSQAPTFGLVKDSFGGRDGGCVFVDYEQVGVVG